MVYYTVMKRIDLTYTLNSAAPVYPGDPATTLSRQKRVSDDGYQLCRFCASTHAGTHIDAPSHVSSTGASLADFPPDAFTGQGRVVDVRGIPLIGPDCFNGTGIQPDNIVLLCTGFSAHAEKPDYYTDHPVVTEGAADMLIDMNVKMLGMDMPGPDRYPFSIHKKLLEHTILLLENAVNLEKLLGIESFRIIALPLKLSADGAPARVIAEIA